MHDSDLGLLLGFAVALVGGAWAVARWKRYGFVVAVALLVAAALLSPLAAECAEMVRLAASLPPEPLALAWLLASAAALISLIAVWAGYHRGHWFWRLFAVTGVLAVLALIEAREAVLFASAVMAPLAAGAWALRRRHDAQQGKGPAGKRPWRWTLAGTLLVFVIIGLVALAVRSVSRGELYVAPTGFATTYGQFSGAMLLATVAGLARGATVRWIASLTAIFMAASVAWFRGAHADDGMGLRYLFFHVDARSEFSLQWIALWIVAQAGIAGVMILACSLFAVVTRGKRPAARRVAGTCLALLLGVLVVPLALVFPGMLPPDVTVAPPLRSPTYEKVQAAGKQATGLKRGGGGVNTALVVQEATAALAEPGHVWFDARRFRRTELALEFDMSFHRESMLALAIDAQAAKAEQAGRAAECLELAILQWRLGRVLRQKGIFMNWASGQQAEQHGCATAAAALGGWSDQDCRRALNELRQSLAGRPDLETVMAYDAYWNRAFFGWRNELAGAALRLLGEDAKPITFLPSREQWTQLDRQALLRLRLLETRLALELYRRAHKQWPERLGELVPEYLAAVPQDPFANRPLIYHRQADDFVLYSVGPDGQDDGGRFHPEWPEQGLDIDWEHDRRARADRWPRKP